MNYLLSSISSWSRNYAICHYVFCYVFTTFEKYPRSMIPVHSTGRDNAFSLFHFDYIACRIVFFSRNIQPLQKHYNISMLDILLWSIEFIFFFHQQYICLNTRLCWLSDKRMFACICVSGVYRCFYVGILRQKRDDNFLSNMSWIRRFMRI